MVTTLKLGFLGAGKIAHDFAVTLNQWADMNHGHHSIIAVGAKDPMKAQRFADNHNIEKSGTYTYVLNMDEIDIVYVNVHHNFHKDIVLQSLNAGKHVLCEKPPGLNLKEVREMTALAREKQLLLVEGFWSKFFPVYDELRILLKDESHGQVRKGLGLFCKYSMPSKGRNLSGAGCLLRQGCYGIMFSNMIFGGKKPEKVIATCHVGDVGGAKTDLDETIILDYGNGRTFQFTCSMIVKTESYAEFFFDDGYHVKIGPMFHSPTWIKTPEGKRVFSYPFEKPTGMYNYVNGEGFVYEADCMRSCILEEKTECPLMTLEESENVAEIWTKSEDRSVCISMLTSTSSAFH